jgi:hypothetical protein
MCWGPLALIFVGTLVSGLTYIGPGHHVTLGTSYFSGIAGVPLVITIVWWLLLWNRRRRLQGPDDCLSGGRDTRRLWMTLWSCVAGILVGVAIRLSLGKVDVTAFCNGSAPLIAGLLIGIVFEGSQGAARRAQSSPPHAVYRQRQLGVVYILVGAICTAVGNIPGQGSLYRALYLVVCGTLAASCYVVMDFVLEKLHPISVAADDA